MECFLSVSGKDFDPSKFLAKSAWRLASNCWQRGTPFNTLEKVFTRRKQRRTSGFQLSVSGDHSDFNITRQMTQVTGFLRRHRREFARLNRAKGVENKQHRFGIFVPSDIGIIWYTFPAEMLRFVGQFGIEIEFSIYGQHDDPDAPVERLKRGIRRGTKGAKA